jgi:hypothetical protein
VETSREPASVINRFYVVESISHALTGEETLQLSHFPVNSEGQSLIALAVANATAPGVILTSNRTGGSCDLAGASSSTNVPAKTTSGTPINPQGTGGGSSITYWAATGAFIDLFSGAGAPSDSPPGPASGGAKQFAGVGGPIPPNTGTNALGGDDRCPNGYNRVQGYFTAPYISNLNFFEDRTLPFTSISGFPSVTPIEDYYPDPSQPEGQNPGPWPQYLISWNDPTTGARSQIGNGMPFYVGLGQLRGRDFAIVATSYSCLTSAGAAGPTVSTRLYKVVEGDSMASISQKMYGTTARANDIKNANTWLMGLDNWGLVPGTVLTIPA